MPVWLLRTEFVSSLEMTQGIRKISRFFQGPTEVAVSNCVIRFQTNGIPVGGNRVGSQPLFPKGFPELVIDVRPVLTKLDGPLVRCGRVCVVSLTDEDIPQQRLVFWQTRVETKRHTQVRGS